MKETIELRCDCGALRGTLSGIFEKRAKRIVCLCDDCQTYAHYLGRAPDVLDRNGGTDIFPATPADMRITAGAEQLRCARLSPKGLLRWYAGCCKTPIANTMSSAKVPYAGIVHSITDHAESGVAREKVLGPVVARIQGRFGVPPLPDGTLRAVSVGVILMNISFLTRAWLAGKGQPSPFFSRAGALTAEPYVLTEDERARFRPQAPIVAK
jgi:hypothetical protein